MATYIPLDKPAQGNIETPLTLTALQTFVGGFIKFVDLSSGDILIANEAGPAFAAVNQTASAMAGRPIHGHVVLASPQEIA